MNKQNKIIMTLTFLSILIVVILISYLIINKQITYEDRALEKCNYKTVSCSVDSDYKGSNFIIQILDQKGHKLAQGEKGQTLVQLNNLIAQTYQCIILETDVYGNIIESVCQEKKSSQLLCVPMTTQTKTPIPSIITPTITLTITPTISTTITPTLTTSPTPTNVTPTPTNVTPTPTNVTPTPTNVTPTPTYITPTPTYYICPPYINEYQLIVEPLVT